MITIGICAPALSAGCEAMFELLGEALGVSFERRTFGDDWRLDGWVVLGADRKLVADIDRATVPCYVVLDEAELMPRGASPTITFENRPELPAPLRGRDVTADDAIGARTLPGWLPNV